MSEPVVITGAAAICGLGREPDAVWGAILEGRSAVRQIRRWDASGWAHGCAAEIDDAQLAGLLADRKLLKRLRRPHVLGIYAGTAAVRQAGWLADRDRRPAREAAEYNDRSGIYVGGGSNAYQDQHDFLPLLARSEGDLVRFGAELEHTVAPMWLLQRLPNNALCHLGIQTGFSGPHACIINHGTSALLAVGEAVGALREGSVDRAVAVAHEAAVEPEAIQGMAAHGVLAPAVLRPFDAGRDGSLFGEGAAALALERRSTAAARGAAILGEVLGSGAACAGSTLVEVQPGGESIERAIEAALADAGCRAGDVGMIVASGDGTRASDAAEARAIRRVFGAAMPPVTAFKWAVGHLAAAAGLLEAVLALAALRAGVVPGIATLRQLARDCAPLAVSAAPQVPRGTVALLVSFGFAETIAALVLRAARDARD
jgi:3-oxoacyl-[acyl-carrier-protein] synthase-1